MNSKGSRLPPGVLLAYARIVFIDEILSATATIGDWNSEKNTGGRTPEKKNQKKLNASYGRGSVLSVKAADSGHRRSVFDCFFLNGLVARIVFSIPHPSVLSMTAPQALPGLLETEIPSTGRFSQP